MRTLTRYLISEFLKLCLLCFGGFVFLYVLVDLVERANQIVKSKAAGHEVLLYVLYSLPQIALQMLPISILLGTILTLALFSRRNELIAVRAAGINMKVFNLPFVAAGVCAALLIFWVQENIVPVSNQKAYEVWKYEIRGKKRKVKLKQENLWLLTSGGVVRIGLYLVESQTMRDVSFYVLSGDFDLVERTDAAEVRWDGERWIAPSAMRRMFADSGFRVEQLRDWTLPIEESPDIFAAAKKKPEEMNAKELKRYIAKLEREGLDATRYIVDYHFKFSFPFIALIMSALAVPFGIRTARQAGLAASVGAAVVLGVVAWLVLALFISFGHSGFLPPKVAAWGMHFIFGSVAIYMWMRMPS